MKPLLRIFAALIAFSAPPCFAADLCEAIALHDVPAIDNPQAVLKKGERDRAVTQYRVNKKTGEASFCSHGGSCYPVFVMDNRQKIEALRLTNCKVGAKDSFEDPDETLYDVDVIRSKIPPKQLRVDDLDNKLLDMGLCSACANNAAYLTVNQPGSRCAKLTEKALEGDPKARDALVKFPDYCNAP